ncbi:Nucleoporin NDC1 [Thoreauomyces humboldtii]|nr:Nucleoporin NDC1 [Thoreauomyces humboldtii]
MLLVTCWELHHRWFEVCFTEVRYKLRKFTKLPPVLTIRTKAVEQKVQTSTSVLAAGLDLPNDEYVKYLAFRRLKNAASYDSFQRMKFYREDADSDHPACIIVVNACLAQIDQLSSSLEKEQIKSQSKRGNPNVRKPALTSKTSLPPVFLQPSKSTGAWAQIAVKARTLLYPPGSPSRGTPEEKDLQPKPMLSPVSTVKPMEIPVLLRRREGTGLQRDSQTQANPIVTLVTPVSRGRVAYTSPGQQTLAAMREWVEKYTWGRWLVGETLTRQTRHLFRDAQLQIWSIEALASLVANAALHSEEDKYGQVSKDLNRVIHALLRCQTAIELRMRAPPLSPDTDPSVVEAMARYQVLNRQPWAVVQVLQISMYRIVRAWYRSLHQQKIDSKYVDKFQRYLDFRE